MTSIFAPYQTRLQIYKNRLQKIVDGISVYDVYSYNSIPEATKALNDIKNDVKAQLAVVQNNIIVTEATLAASVAAKAPSGIAKALQMITTWAEEVSAAAKCFSLIEEVSILLLKIPALLALKSAELQELSVKLSLDKTVSYLTDLKTNTINVINKAKTDAVTETKNLIFGQKLKETTTALNKNKQDITNRSEYLKSQGVSDQDIQKDSQISALYSEQKTLSALLDLINEQIF